MNKKLRLVFFARKHLGKPYKFGAKYYEAPKTFDCSSFIQYLYSMIGIKLPRTALDQASVGKNIELRKKNLQVGDLLFFKGGWGHYNPEFPMGVGHVGMYVGNGKVINARSREVNGTEKGSVIEESAEDFLNRKDFVAVKRIIWV